MRSVGAAKRSAGKKRIRVVLADDHQLFVDGTTKLLEEAPDIELLGQALDGHQAVALTRKLNPDVLLLDYTLPGQDGAVVTEQVRLHAPATQILIVTMHVGVWDLGAAALAAYDYPINAIADSFRYPKMNDLVHGSRERLGMKVIPMDRVGPAVFRALKRGEILAMLIDTPLPGQEITVDFLGAPAEVSAVPARIALRTGAWVVPSVVLRGPQRDTIIRPVIDIHAAKYEPTGDEERDVVALTRLIMGALEAAVRAHPEQWYIFHPMWRGARRAVEGGALTQV